MNSVAILQARTNSTRLPGKVLLPVSGIPLVVLAARRAANTGRKVIVATSNEKTDDVLALLLANEGISCFRGSLNNTLQRFVDALEGFSDDTLVFRLTADNVFPDGALLDEMQEEFVGRKLKYLCCNGESSGLPYGMSAELTRVQYLREAALITKSEYDQEHVTPFIKRAFGNTYFQKYKNLRVGGRCTVDYMEDYLRIQKVFSEIDFPQHISALELIKRLPKVCRQPESFGCAKKLVLGGAQLGLAYGITNKVGKPQQKIADLLINTAIVNGVDYIETARSYGDSEAVIGNSLGNRLGRRPKIITKLSTLPDCPSGASSAIVNAFIDASIFQSCSDLQTKTLDVLMLHRASHINDWFGAVWARLLKHKANGRLKALGVSIQTPTELAQALSVPEVEFIQMPFNLLDWRWDKIIPMLKEIKRQRSLVVHVRSALLQGVLVSTDDEHWRKAKIENSGLVMEWLMSHCSKLGCNSLANFCLSYVKSQDWVDGVVVGMEASYQLKENIEIFSGRNFTADEINSILMSRPILSEESLNPALWNIKYE